jgi:hypothetical protein
MQWRTELMLNRPDGLGKVTRQRGVLGQSSEECLLGRLLWCALVCRRTYAALLSSGARPHCDLLCPWIVQRRPGRLSLASSVVGATTSTTTSRGVPAMGVASGLAGTTSGRRDTSRGRGDGGSSGPGNESGGRRRRVGVDLLEYEIIADVGEGGERLRALEVDLHVGELLIQATHHVQDEGTVVDDLTKIIKGLGHPPSSCDNSRRRRDRPA